MNEDKTMDKFTEFQEFGLRWFMCRECGEIHSHKESNGGCRQCSASRALMIVIVIAALIGIAIGV
jgi:rubrerythrin